MTPVSEAIAVACGEWAAVLTNPCAWAVRYRLFTMYELNQALVTISNKAKLPHHHPKPEPEFRCGEWVGGYIFKHFWSNCRAWLGALADVDGVQQLCHHYYLRNGSLSARQAAAAIKRFLSIESERT